MPDYDASFEGIYQDKGEEKTTNAFFYKVDEDFIKVIGAKLIEGRNFDPANPKEGILSIRPLPNSFSREILLVRRIKC